MIKIGLNKNGAVCSWNCGAEVVMGFRRSDALGLGFFDDLLDVEGQQKFLGSLSLAREGRMTGHVGLPFYTLAGERVDLSLVAARCQRRTEEAGGGTAPEAEHVVLTGGPLTEDAPRKISVDREGHISDWGDEVARATGFYLAEVLGLSFTGDIVTRDLRDLVLEKLRRALADESVPAFELPVFAKDATKKTFEVRLAPDGIKGKIVGATFILTEIAEEETDTSDEKVKTNEPLSACVTPAASGEAKDTQASCEVPTSDTLSTCVPWARASSGWTRDTLISYVQQTQESLIRYTHLSQDL